MDLFAAHMRPKAFEFAAVRGQVAFVDTGLDQEGLGLEVDHRIAVIVRVHRRCEGSRAASLAIDFDGPAMKQAVDPDPGQGLGPAFSGASFATRLTRACLHSLAATAAHRSVAQGQWRPGSAAMA